ncbi:CapA family protein [Nostocoides sp. F2B08]|uniref:CapA family protein n=1 Tax=Nostocoides sp. F2B08 TaxID=2653936 RepID=UPI001263B8E7|nr:CapA family protein [Tetrasphaera sp. F2B08]
MRRTWRWLPTLGAAMALAACSGLGSGAQPDGAGDPTALATSAPTTATSTATSEPVTVTIVAAGDILPHAPVIANAARNAEGSIAEFDFAPMLEEVSPFIEGADLGICHLETPLSADNTGLTQPRTLVFNSPREVATGLHAAGFDGCDFASNHSWDRGLDGLAQTIDVLEEEGLGYAGPQADESRAGEPALYEIGDVTVAHLAYSYTLLNNGGPNTEVPPDAPWLSRAMWPVVEAEGIAADAQAARDSGADLVVLSMHWGEEYVATPTADQRRLARELLGTGAVDLIIGTHVHVIQPCETVNGRTVFYGLGNFLSNQSPDTTGGRLLPTTQEGMMARATFTIDPDGDVTSAVDYQPTRVDLDGYVVEPATPQTHPTTFARTVETLGSLPDGTCDAVPVEDVASAG